MPGTGASATTANVEEMSVPAVLRVVAAAVVVERRLLLMSKRAAPEVFYLPGGKPDQGESELDCLRREIAEELSVGIVQPRLWTSVTSPAALERCPMEMTVYRAELDGEPKAASEVAALAWYADAGSFEGSLAPAIEHDVVPRLRTAGLLA